MIVDININPSRSAAIYLQVYRCVASARAGRCKLLMKNVLLTIPIVPRRVPDKHLPAARHEDRDRGDDHIARETRLFVCVTTW